MLAVSFFFFRSWKELSGSERQQAASAFQERDASKSGSGSGSGSGRDEGEAAASGASPPSTERNPWERYGARYFKGAIKAKGAGAGGKDRTVHVQVEVRGGGKSLWRHLHVRRGSFVGDMPLLYS